MPVTNVISFTKVFLWSWRDRIHFSVPFHRYFKVNFKTRYKFLVTYCSTPAHTYLFTFKYLITVELG
jgi:hypothetical protein